MKEAIVWNNKDLLQILPFYNTLIERNSLDCMEKPKIKRLSNVELLNVLPFYDNLNIKEISKAFRRYSKSYDTKKLYFKKLNETKLTNKDKFFSSLKNENSSEKDYLRAKNIWKTLK